MSVSNEIRNQFELQGKESKQKYTLQMQQDQIYLQITPHSTIEDLKHRYTQPLPELQGHTQLYPTDHQKYADGAIIRHEQKQKEDHELIIQLKNYTKVTKGRQIPIQWRKTEILTKTNR